ncbi:hypothetical protein V6615_15065 [Oscillospiraceae bacterium PP1C4]
MLYIIEKQQRTICMILICTFIVTFISACKNEMAYSQSDFHVSSNQEQVMAGVDYRNVIPDTAEELTDETEKKFLLFAQNYSICCSNINFRSVDDLSDADKYLLFRFFQDNITYQKGTPNKLEKELYSEKEDAVIVPVAIVRQWLHIYLGTDSFNPSNALTTAFEGINRHGKRPYGYDLNNDVFVVPSLSGFGGVRACGLLNTENKDGIITMDIGFYNPEKLYNNPPVYDLYSCVKMQVKPTLDDPMQFQLLSWVTTVYNEDGTQSVIDMPQVNL